MGFLDRIFNDAGYKIKKIAKIVYLIDIICAGLLLLGCLIETIDSGEIYALLGGLVIAAAWLGVTYVSTLFLCAFGELVESSSANRSINSRILSVLSQQYATAYPPQPVYRPAPPPVPQPTYQPAPPPVPQPTYQPAPPPVPQPTYQPATQPVPQPDYQSAPRLVPQPAPRPAPQPAPQPAYQPIQMSKPKKLTVLDIPPAERTLPQILEYALQYSSDDGLRNQLVFQIRADVDPRIKETCQNLINLPNGQIRAAVQQHLNDLQ